MFEHGEGVPQDDAKAAEYYTRACDAGLALGCSNLGQLQKAIGQVTAEVPLADGAQVAEHRGGLFTMSPDGRFLAGPASDVPGLWVVSGCNGSGFSSSPAIGELMAAGIAADATPPGLAGFSPDRFGPLTDAALVEAGTWQYAHYYDPAVEARP